MNATTRSLALVTGASSGIGLALAHQFVEHDYDVIITADGDLESARRELENAGGGVHAITADLAVPTGIASLWEQLQALGRPLDVAALNAGVGVSGDFVRDVSLEADLRLIAVNVTAVVHLAKLVVPPMVDRGRGKVLITSSIAATMPGPYYATYAASKAFLQSFAQAIRYELRDTGVSVTALQPGPTDTNFFDRAGMEGTKVAQAKKDDPAQVARDGFDALMAGKDHVVAGSAKNKAQVMAGRLMSEKTKAGIHAMQTKPDNQN